MAVVPTTAAGKTALIGGGLVLGLWEQIKLYSSKVYGLFIIRASFDMQLAEAISRLLCTKFKCSRIGAKNFTGFNEYVRPLTRNQLVGFEKIPREPTVWWRGTKPLLVSIDSENQNVRISFIRGFYNLRELVLEAINKFNAQKSDRDWKVEDRFWITKKRGSIGRASENNYLKKGVDSQEVSVSTSKYNAIPVGWQREELGQPKKDNAASILSLEKSAISFLHDAVLWRDSEKWFKTRAIPWKRGALFYGAPGTGKTAFTRALGQELNMPVFSFDLATMTNSDFAEVWEDVMGYTPCIALFEDVDNIFKGRDNISVKGMQNGLTFDCFLNHLDGVDNTDGIFIIVTTNCVESLDSALGAASENGISTRPGRIDTAIKFDILTEAGRIKMAKRILGDFPEEDWEHLYTEGQRDTGAQFQERCCRYALDLFWKRKQG